LRPAASTIYRTASPLKRAVKDFVDPPVVAAPAVVTPLAGLNHSTFRTRVVADKFTVKVPPLGA
jgi:hypothetical protein